MSGSRVAATATAPTGNEVQPRCDKRRGQQPQDQETETSPPREVVGPARDHDAARSGAAAGTDSPSGDDGLQGQRDDVADQHESEQRCYRAIASRSQPSRGNQVAAVTQEVGRRQSDGDGEAAPAGPARGREGGLGQRCPSVPVRRGLAQYSRGRRGVRQPYGVTRSGRRKRDATRPVDPSRVDAAAASRLVRGAGAGHPGSGDGSGFVLSYDMVFVPRLDLTRDALGLGSALPRAVPVDAVAAS